MRLVLLSNGYSPDGGRYLGHALRALSEALTGVREVAFVPYGLRDWNGHTAAVAAGLAPLGVEVAGVHRYTAPRSALESAEAVFVGGGNAFRLLAALYRLGVVDVIAARIRDGAPYIGTSAGTNVACPTIRTTNDMPIAEPPTLTALGLVPFQVNPHYPARQTLDGHLGETRDKRIAEFLEDNDVPVLALQEGAWLSVDGAQVTTGGVRGARLFRRMAAATDIGPGTNVSQLLTTTCRFDHAMP